uniref:LAGLIDADG homing endonuclease n=1 Tax=Funneliformis coronatus TaxID=1117309 RepID=D5G3N8_9GLOM|nr:LAGLIDADG homing endonuclease [Funneliformis coronatus]
MKSPNLQPAKALALSPIQREILVGGMLGDLSIYRAKLTHNARLYVQQGAVHSEYLNHLSSVLIYGPKVYVSLDSFFQLQRVVWKKKRSNTTYEALRFNTRSLPCFNYYREVFYPDPGLALSPWAALGPWTEGPRS